MVCAKRDKPKKSLHKVVCMSVLICDCQIRCLSNIADTWQLPDQLENAVLFSYEGFAALGQQ